jgi:hypothetical protein
MEVGCKKWTILKANMVDGGKSIPHFPKWFQVVIDGYAWAPIKENEHEFWELLVPPTFMVNYYINMVAYDNHFQFASKPCNNMVIYDFGVMGQFE